MSKSEILLKTDLGYQVSDIYHQMTKVILHSNEDQNFICYFYLTQISLMFDFQFSGEEIICVSNAFENSRSNGRDFSVFHGRSIFHSSFVPDSFIINDQNSVYLKRNTLIH